MPRLLYFIWRSPPPQSHWYVSIYTDLPVAQRTLVITFDMYTKSNHISPADIPNWYFMTGWSEGISMRATPAGVPPLAALRRNTNSDASYMTTCSTMDITSRTMDSRRDFGSIEHTHRTIPTLISHSPKGILPITSHGRQSNFWTRRITTKF